jgi:hypothetical protein
MILLFFSVWYMITTVIPLVFVFGKHVSLLIQIFLYLCVQGGSWTGAFCKHSGHFLPSFLAYLYLNLFSFGILDSVSMPVLFLDDDYSLLLMKFSASFKMFPLLKLLLPSAPTFSEWMKHTRLIYVPRYVLHPDANPSGSKDVAPDSAATNKKNSQGKGLSC